MALRGDARFKLALGVEPGKVAYDLVHAGTNAGLSGDDIRGIVADLRAEGLLPEEEEVT